MLLKLSSMTADWPIPDLRDVGDVLALMQDATIMTNGMRKSIWLVVAVVLCGPAALWGQATYPAASPRPRSLRPAHPPADNNARLDQLEAETQSLWAEAQWLREHPVRLPDVTATPTAMAAADRGGSATDRSNITLDELRGEMKKYAWKKGDFTITPYGYIWGNMVVSTERTDPGQLYVVRARRPAATEVRESEFVTDVRNTRLGFDLGRTDKSLVWYAIPDRRQVRNRFSERPASTDREQTRRRSCSGTPTWK